MAVLSETRLPAGQIRSSGMMDLLPCLSRTGTLPAVAPRQFVRDTVEHVPFLRAPPRRQQNIGGSGAGDAVVHHLPRRTLDQVGCNARIVRLAQRFVFATLPFDGEPGVLHHMQRMKLEAIDADLEHTIETDVAVGSVLAGQADDEVAADRDAARPRGPRRRLVFRETVAA